MLRRLDSSEFSFKSLAFEVVVVVLGVLIALGVGEVQQEWEEGRRADETARALHAELAQNCVSLQYFVKRPVLVEQLSGLLRSDPLAASMDYLPIMQSDTSLVGRPYLTHVAFDAAQATGTLRLFEFEVVRQIGGAYTFTEQYEELMRAVTPRMLDAFPADNPDSPDLRVVLNLLRPIADMERQMRPIVCDARDLLADRFGFELLAGTESSDTATVQGRMLLPETD